MKSETIFILSACLFVCTNVLGQTFRNQECRCSCATTEPFIRIVEQGRPGKVGPPGPPGPMGLIGAPGSCGCDPNEIERLNSTIQTLLGENIVVRNFDMKTFFQIFVLFLVKKTTRGKPIYRQEYDQENLILFLIL